MSKNTNTYLALSVVLAALAVTVPSQATNSDHSMNDKAMMDSVQTTDNTKKECDKSIEKIEKDSKKSMKDKKKQSDNKSKKIEREDDHKPQDHEKINEADDHKPHDHDKVMDSTKLMDENTTDKNTMEDKKPREEEKKS